MDINADKLKLIHSAPVINQLYVCVFVCVRERERELIYRHPVLLPVLMINKFHKYKLLKQGVIEVQQDEL